MQAILVQKRRMRALAVRTIGLIGLTTQLGTVPVPIRPSVLPCEHASRSELRLRLGGLIGGLRNQPFAGRAAVRFASVETGLPRDTGPSASTGSGLGD